MNSVISFSFSIALYALANLLLVSSEQEYLGSEDVQVLASFEYDECHVDSDACWSHGGPHMVSSV